MQEHPLRSSSQEWDGTFSWLSCSTKSYHLCKLTWSPYCPHLCLSPWNHLHQVWWFVVKIVWWGNNLEETKSSSTGMEDYPTLLPPSPFLYLAFIGSWRALFRDSASLDPIFLTFFCDDIIPRTQIKQTSITIKSKKNLKSFLWRCKFELSKPG